MTNNESDFLGFDDELEIVEAYYEIQDRLKLLKLDINTMGEWATGFQSTKLNQSFAKANKVIEELESEFLNLEW